MLRYTPTINLQKGPGTRKILCRIDYFSVPNEARYHAALHPDLNLTRAGFARWESMPEYGR